MFSNLFKEKRIIEEKIRALQNKYISLRQQSIVGNSREEGDKNCVKDTLAQKQAVLNKIKQEYTEIDRVYKSLHKLLSETKETTLRTEELIDKLADSLNIEFPEELTREEPKKSVTESAQIQTSDEENQLSDNNIENNVEDFDSDKENSKADITSTTSPDYYSPILQIRKSVPENDQLYTPAIRSKSKRRLAYHK